MHGKQQDEQQEPIPIGSGRPNGAAVLRMLRPASGKPITQRQRGDGPINSSAMTPSKQGKTAPAIFQGCIFTNCTGAKSAVATSAFNYIEQLGGLLLSESDISKATHIVLQHQQQPAYAKAVHLEKQTVSCYWVLACVQQGRLLACNDMLHQPFPSASIPGTQEQHGNKVQYQCGVSVTGFQGMQRQILLDILGCMGVDVQKEMKLGHATHIVAQDVDDSTSKKLQHARMAMWRDTITIVSCKWVYDCARQWKILPAGPYMSNCTSIEAVSWQGSSQVFNHIANDPTKQTAQRTSLPARDATAALGGRAGHSAAKQPAGNAPSTRPTAVAAAMVAGTSTAPPQAMQGGSHRKAGMQSRSSVASQLQQPQQQGVQPVEPVLPQRQSAEAAIGNRESVSGTQGAVTSLTHLALQKHDEAMQFAAAASRLYAGPMPSEDTQALGLEVAL